MSFSLAWVLNMGQIVLIRWIMNISTVSPWKLRSLRYTFPSKASELTIRPRHFACDEGWTRQKARQLDRIEGLIHMSRAVLKPTLGHVESDP
jgi:hypothetical protein